MDAQSRFIRTVHCIAVTVLVLATEASAGSTEVWPVAKSTGALCIGRDLSPVTPNPKLMVTVDDQPKISVGENAGKIAFQGLDLKRRHRIQFFDDSVPLASWTVRFKKSNLIFVWKAYGAWKSKPIATGICSDTVP